MIKDKVKDVEDCIQEVILLYKLMDFEIEKTSSQSVDYVIFYQDNSLKFKLTIKKTIEGKMFCVLLEGFGIHYKNRILDLFAKDLKVDVGIRKVALYPHYAYAKSYIYEGMNIIFSKLKSL